MICFNNYVEFQYYRCGLLSLKQDLIQVCTCGYILNRGYPPQTKAGL